VNAILAAVEEHRARAVVCCFGPDAAPYRVELYEGYHADREPPPDDLAWQWERVAGLYEALGWSVDADESVEGDDLLGPYAREKTAADILRRRGSLEAALEAAASGTSLAGQREQLLAFKEIATLRRLKVKRPADRDTDRASGAAAARELGLNRLAKRLEEA